MSEGAAARHERVRAFLDRGAPWEACDAFRDGGGPALRDPGWLFLGALAHARAGAVSEAHALLDRAQQAAQDAPAELRTDILALRGRLFKDALREAAAGPEADALARRARDEYRAAYDVSAAAFPAINAATLSLLLGERDRAHALATGVEAALAESRAPLAGWDLLTAAEAALVRGDDRLAAARYAAAWREARDDAGRIASARRQLALLARVLPAAHAMLAVLRPPDVVAFAGHMIDAPGRAEPRFPPSLESAVSAVLREHASRWHAPIVFASAACGADLLMLEAALAAGAEVNVVLPFARDEFVRTSVAPAGAGWVERFDAALARAARVLLATPEAYLGDDALYAYAAQLVEGLAVLRAAQLETQARLLAVLEPGTAEHPGGTLEAVRRWQGNGGAADVVDLRALRAAEAPASAVADTRPAPPPDAPRTDARRTQKAMLFADVAGYSRLDDAQVPRFQRLFWDAAAAQLDDTQRPALLANTWGDGLFVVFASPAEAAAFAVGLRDRMRAIAWAREGLPASTAIRIALHAAPVFSGHDPVLRRENYFGAGVTRAARIEPVTPPGLIYASEAFAAVLSATARGWRPEYVGTLHLAKQYGESRLYRLEAGACLDPGTSL